MTPVLVACLGYLLGSIPTANAIASLKGVDLLAEGSGNPGANNARRVGGVGLGLLVLLVEMGKGATAVALGAAFDHRWAVVIASLAVVAGNVFNPWYRLRGGQGLGITGGVLAAAVPAGFIGGVVGAAATALSTRSAPKSSIAGLAAMIGSVAWFEPRWWGMDRPGNLALAVGVTALITPGQIRNLAGELRSSARRPSRGGSSPDPD